MYKTLSLYLGFILITGTVKAQQIDSIYVHLYTDSLKKGTYNYINIDGRLSNGRFLPLDSTQVDFSSSHGKFFGNSLWLDPGTKEEKVKIVAILKKNTAIRKDFIVYIKKNPDNGRLKTEQEILGELKSKGKKEKG